MHQFWAEMVLAIIGIIAGVAFQLNWWAAKGWFESLDHPASLVWLFRTALLATAVLFGLRAAVRWAVGRLPLPSRIKSNYRKYDTLTYFVFVLLLAGAGGINQLSIPFFYIIGFAFLVAQFLLAFVLLKNTEEGERFFLSLGWLCLLFLLSGVAALMYQIVWQRVLFAAYGVNIESVTIIVSIFMFGLGVGSLVGGILSKKFPSHLPQLFVLCEVAIGCFGIASLSLINWVTDATVYGSLLEISLVTYGLLCVPTIFMGATLPILVSHLNRYYKHIGKSVGTLYFFNTIGSAVASLVTVDVLFRFMGQRSTVFIAAMFNFLVAILVFAYCRKLPRHGANVEMATELPSHDQGKSINSISYSLTLLLAGGAGYVSLSQEIVWMRAISYATGGVPHVFGHILGFFLFGVAAGALVGKKVCIKNNIRPLTFIAWMFLATALFYYLSIPISSFVIAASWRAGMVVSYLTVAMTAFLLGSIFPVLCHFGIRSDAAVGLSLSGIYVANILGSTAGPLITGFVLMNYWTMEQIILYLSVLSLVMAAWIGLLGAQGMKARVVVLSGALGTVAALFVLQDGLYQRVLERLQFVKVDSIHNGFKYVVQNRSGIITVIPKENGDIIFGGGVYEGYFNIDPVVNSNGIRRAYMLAALHSNPQEVLQIGAGSGSHTWVIAAYPGVKKLTTVEINPGHLELVKQYPDHRSILSNPKISYYFDDGRRWLRRHPEAKFDFIFMNTTFHWRSNATNLLSREFLELCRDHLKEGGVLYYNFNTAEDSVFTAASVFKYVTTYGGYVAASDRSFDMRAEEKRRNLLKFRDGSRVILDGGDPALHTLLEEMVVSDLGDKGEEIRRRADLRLITEDNMLTEFKSSKHPIADLYRWYDPRASWKNFGGILTFLRE